MYLGVVFVGRALVRPMVHRTAGGTTKGENSDRPSVRSRLGHRRRSSREDAAKSRPALRSRSPPRSSPAELRRIEVLTESKKDDSLSRLKREALASRQDRLQEREHERLREREKERDREHGRRQEHTQKAPQREDDDAEETYLLDDMEEGKFSQGGGSRCLIACNLMFVFMLIAVVCEIKGSKPAQACENLDWGCKIYSKSYSNPF